MRKKIYPRKKIAELKYPSTDNIGNRTSTIARSMACTIATITSCTEDMEKEWLDIFDPNNEGLTCAYCGDKATHLDHLLPLIIKGSPTGYGTEPGNLVPCCGNCNQSKGNKDWDVYINEINSEENAKSRIQTIESLLQKFKPQKRVFDEEFEKKWEDIKSKCNDALREAQISLEDLIKQYPPK
ncbi:MAG: HNH endonuclease [Paludibacteraceae bacterium]|nr:HNH endonuclease [Paludibacteraceae bacterium]